MKKHYLLTGCIATAVALSGTTALADYASDIEGNGPASGVTYDDAANPGSFPVVTAVLSKLGTYGGHNYTSDSFLAEDATGSLDIYAYSTTAVGSTYVPTVGDAISATGKYAPYNQIPELGTPTAFTLQSRGNAAPGPVGTTVSAVNVSTLPQNLAGYYLQLNNVTIGGSGGVNGNFPTYAQATVGTETFTVTDGTGSMTLFDWVTSYSTDGAMGGDAIPTGTVPYIDGFVSIYTPTSGVGVGIAQPEFVPTFIPGLVQGVPEPSVLNLLGVGGAGSLLAFISRFRKKA